MLRFEDIRFDCALYNGYKPCRHGNECAGCPHVEAMPPPAAVREPARPSATRPAGPPRILIIKTGAMGDVLRTTALLAPLLRMHAGARITWVTDRSAAPLLEGNPAIAELLLFPSPECDALAAREFDLLLNFEKDRALLELAAAVPARDRAGFAPTPWGTPTVFNPESRYALLLGLSDELKFRVNRKPYPQVVAEMARAEYRRDPYALHLSPESVARRGELLAALPAPARPRIGINTGCGPVFRTKQWTLEGWVELAGLLRERADADILLLGGKAEAELNRDILARTAGVIDTGTANSLTAFPGVVDACDIVVSSDSLAMHIAIALGKRVVAIFGSTTPHEVDLYDRGEKVVTDFECSPCYLKTCDKSPTCMQALRGAMVGEAVLRQLSALKARPAAI
jgi:ADP-heptose:LPS heptosyltransferase